MADVTLACSLAALANAVAFVTATALIRLVHDDKCFVVVKSVLGESDTDDAVAAADDDVIVGASLFSSRDSVGGGGGIVVALWLWSVLVFVPTVVPSSDFFSSSKVISPFTTTFGTFNFGNAVATELVVVLLVVPPPVFVLSGASTSVLVSTMLMFEWSIIVSIGTTTATFSADS